MALRSTSSQAARGGTLHFADLEALPLHSAVYLLRCGARWLKAITEISLATPGLPQQPLPV